jgi:hypothetical protein
VLKPLAVLAALTAAIGATGCGSNTKPSPPPSSANLLVDIARNKRVSPTDPEVVSVQRYLPSLSRRCRESEATLAIDIAAALSILGKHGLHDPRGALNLTEDLDRVQAYGETKDVGKRPIPCLGLLSALVSAFRSGK